MTTSEQIDAALRAAGIVLDGCAVLKPDRVLEPGWFVVTRLDDLRVRLDGVPLAQQPLATVTVMGLDLTPAGQATAHVAEMRRQAKDILNSPEAHAVLHRAMMLVLLDDGKMKDIKDKIKVGKKAEAMADLKGAIAAELDAGTAD